MWEPGAAVLGDRGGCGNLGQSVLGDRGGCGNLGQQSWGTGEGVGTYTLCPLSPPDTRDRSTPVVDVALL